MASAAAVKPMDVDSDDEKDQIIHQDNTLTIDIRKNSYGPIFYLTFTFTKEIHGFKGDVVTTIWNYEGRPESHKIELALVRISKKNQGKGLCKPMVMYCMKKTIVFYRNVKKRNPKFVQIDVVSRMPERAVNCYVSVLSALGLIQMQSEKEKDETSWINHYIDYTFPENWNPSWLREEVLLLHESDRYFELEKPPPLKDELAAAAKQGGRRKTKRKKRKKRKTKRRKRRKKKTRKKRGGLEEEIQEIQPFPVHLISEQAQNAYNIMEVQVALNHWWANELTPQQRAGIIMGEGEGGRFNPRTFRVLIDEAIRRLQEQQQGGRRKKKTRKKRGRGKCVSKPKYHDEEEIDKRIAENIKHMNIQSQKLEEIINASTCEDGTVDLKQMLENIKKHKGGRRKKKSRRRK